MLQSNTFMQSVFERDLDGVDAPDGLPTFADDDGIARLDMPETSAQIRF
jgi:hypothetical protein